MRKKKRAILIPLGDLKHRLTADQHALSRIALHLRDFHATHSTNLVCDVIKELDDFNADRLGNIVDMVNQIIEEA